MPDQEVDIIVSGLDSIPALGTVLDFVMAAESWGQEEPWKLATEWIQKEVDQIIAAVSATNEGLNILFDTVAQDENQARLTAVGDASSATAGNAQDLALRISLSPDSTYERRVIASQAGGLADKFLLIDPTQPDQLRDIWKWTYVNQVWMYGDDNVFKGLTADRLAPNFTVTLALPVYATAIMLLIAAIDLDTGGDLATVRERYGDVLLRHIGQTDPTPAPGALTLPEQIRARVSCVIAPATIYADSNAQCIFNFAMQNLMTHELKPDHKAIATVAERGTTVMCTYTPEMSAPWDELFQDAAGVALLRELNGLLKTVYEQGSFENSSSVSLS